MTNTLAPHTELTPAASEFDNAHAPMASLAAKVKDDLGVIGSDIAQTYRDASLAVAEKINPAGVAERKQPNIEVIEGGGVRPGLVRGL